MPPKRPASPASGLAAARPPRSTAGADDARYARLRDLLELCVSLEGSLAGVTIADVERRYEVSRRTAMRMLAAVREALGAEAFDAETGPDGQKRWRLRAPWTGRLARLAGWSAAELAALENAARLARRDGRVAEGRALTRALEQIRALLRPELAARVDPDLEALVEAQGLGMRAGPRPRVERRVVDALREAVLACRKVELHHRAADRAPLRRHTVGPLGFLYGNRHYLVAWSARRGAALLFRLSRIARVRALPDAFEPPDGFDLRRFAEGSFGVFQEDAVDAVWRFAPEVAAEARQFVFHPTQRLESRRDGSLVVRFRAGGLREMAWHLFTWGPHVEVLEPPALRRELVALLDEALARHRPRAKTRRPRAASRSVEA